MPSARLVAPRHLLSSLTFVIPPLLQKQLEGKPDKESIAELASKLPPLAREPFEFCAPGTAAERLAGSGGSAGASSGASVARPAAGAPERLAAPAQLAPADAAIGASAGKGGSPPAAAASPGAPAAAPPASAEEESKKKQKKKGRLWRLMYGDESDSGMHQPADVF